VALVNETMAATFWPGTSPRPAVKPLRRAALAHHGGRGEGRQAGRRRQEDGNRALLSYGTGRRAFRFADRT
jgi:hypothetical protein